MIWSNSRHHFRRVRLGNYTEAYDSAASVVHGIFVGMTIDAAITVLVGT